MLTSSPVRGGDLLRTLAGPGVPPGVLTGVPCSYLGAVFAAGSVPPWRTVPATSEGEAVAVACGLLAGGGSAVVAMQNSGLGHALDPLTSLAMPAGLPVPLVVSHRGHPDDERLEQHEVMGRITLDLLAVAGIPAVALRGTDPAALAELVSAARAAGRPFAAVVRAGDLAPSLPAGTAGPGASGDTRDHRPAPGAPRPPRPPAAPPRANGRRPSRAEAITALASARPAGTVTVATNGHTSREVFALADDDRTLCLSGSMGYASPVALGIALARPGQDVLAVDGDGALLMHLGNLATAGAVGCPRFRHVVLDNGVHASTGGQPTASATVDFVALALSAGYRSAATAPAFPTLDAAAAWLHSQPGPVLLHVPIGAGTLPSLPRISLSLAEQVSRLRAALAAPEEP